MAEIDNLVEAYFRKEEKTKTASLDFIMEAIDEVYNELISEKQTRPMADTGLDASEQKSVDIKFPKIRISEDFGKIGTGDRATIEKFAKNIAGSTLEEKISNLNSVLEDANPDVTIGQLLSTMVITEILSAIVTNFTESAGGFIFEGFLAGLFGGKSVQIVDPKDIEGMDAAGKPITDVVLGGRHYSLKLLGETTGVKGSFRNMVNHFKTVNHVVYLDARRIGKDQGLQFGEFTITLENFLDVFVTPFLKQVAKSKPIKVKTGAKLKQLLNKLSAEGKPVKVIRAQTRLPAPYNAKVFSFSPATADKLNEGALSPNDFKKLIDQLMNTPDRQLSKFGPWTVVHADQKFEGTKAEKLFGNFSLVEEIKAAIEADDREQIISKLEKTPGYTDPQQFEFTRKQAEDIASFKEIGRLMIGPPYMKKAFANYANILRDTLTPVYDNLQLFTDNVNDYFLGVSGEGTEQNRKQYAMNAIQNANDLEKSTNRAVEKIEKTT